jgi:hypothetical protein
MISDSSISWPFFAFIWRLSRKPLLFKSFAGLTVQEFDNIYDKEIIKRYDKHEIQRLSKKYRERKVGAGRPFNLDVRNRF